MPGAEAFFNSPRWRAGLNRGTIIHGWTRKPPLQIPPDVSQTRPRNRLRILRLEYGRRANEVVWNPEADSEMVREIVPASKGQIVYRYVSTRAAFESRTQCPARVEPFIGLRSSAGCRVTTLRLTPLRSAQ